MILTVFVFCALIIIKCQSTDNKVLYELILGQRFKLKLSVGQMSPMHLLAKCPLAKCPLAKCPLAKWALAKCPLAKCPLAKCPLAKCPLAKCPLAKWALAKCPDTVLHGLYLA